MSGGSGSGRCHSNAADLLGGPYQHWCFSGTGTQEGIGPCAVWATTKSYWTFKEWHKQLIIMTSAQYLWLTGEFRDFTWSHGDDHSFPNSQFKLFAQDELHGFAAPPHLPGVIQDCPIAEAGAIMEYHLVIQTQYLRSINLSHHIA